MATTSKCTTPPVDYIKDVRRNRANRDWDAFVTIVATGETIQLGSRERSWDAEQLCDVYVFNQLQHQPLMLDGVAVEVEIEDADTADPLAVVTLTHEQYTAYMGSDDSSLVLQLGDDDNWIELTADQLTELERIIAAGILRRLWDIARLAVGAQPAARQAAA